MKTSWLIGSVKDLPAQSMSVNVSDAQTRTVATGSYYLYDNTGSRSLLEQVAAAINGHTQISDVGARLLDSGHVEIFHASTSFSIGWTSTKLRDLLGFTGNTGSATSHVAQNKSPLFWSPGRTETSAARFGSQGFYAYDLSVSQSAPGRVVATHHNSYFTNKFSWEHVEVARVWQEPSVGGTFERIWREVCVNYCNVKLYRNVDEGNGSSAPSLSSLPVLGPYVVDIGRTGQMGYSRGFSSVEYTNMVDFSVVGTQDY